MASLVATADPATGSVLIELDRIIAYDVFNRNVANAWGNANVGGLWSVSGGAAADYSVVDPPAVGRHSLTSTNVARSSTIVSSITDASINVEFGIPVNPSGAPVEAGITARIGADFYYIQVQLSPGGAATVSILRNLAASALGTATIPGFVVSASNNIALWVELEGTKLRAAAASLGSVQPPWQVEVDDIYLTSGFFGLRSMRSTGNANGTYFTNFGYFLGLAGVEPLTIYRVTPDGVQTAVRGSGFFTSSPAESAVLWDNEAPFDVDIFYVLRSPDSTAPSLTSNTVNLDSDGLGWLRDPYTPAYNIAFETEGDIFDFCDDVPRIMFAGLSGKTHTSASGVFEIIDAQRPDTVSQTRKRYGSALVLISKELEDIDAIEQIIAGGYPLILSLPPVYGFGSPYGTDWITVFDVDALPIGSDQRLPARAWSLPFRLSTPAADIDTGGTGGSPIGGGDATFDILAASALGLTFNSLTASGLTFDDIAAGTGY